MDNFKKLIKEALTPNFLKEGVDREIWNDADEETRMQMIVDATDDSDLAERYFDRKWDELPPEISSNLKESVNENMALSKELENHPDFDVLVTALEDSLGIEIERMLKSGRYNGREGYYLRTPDVNTWTENAKETITRALDKANAKAQDHTFEFAGVSDYELEPGERSWDASIEFFADKEEEEEMWIDPAGGTHYGDDDDPAASYMEESVNEGKEKWIVYDIETKKRLPNPGKSWATMKAAQAFADKQENAEVASDTFYFDKIQESVNETIKKGDKFTSDDYGKTINWWVVKHDGGAIELDNDHPRYSRFALSVKDFEKKVKNGEFKPINEMDMNDPVLAMVRRRQMQDDAEEAKQAELDKKYGKNFMDRLDAERVLKQQLGDLKDEREQIMIDMEQEAEPEGGEIADDYGSRLNDIDSRMGLIQKDIDDLRMYESVDEELETPNELADESKQDTSASGAYESKTFDFKKMIKESLKPNYLK